MSIYLVSFSVLCFGDEVLSTHSSHNEAEKALITAALERGWDVSTQDNTIYKPDHDTDNYFKIDTFKLS